MTPKAEGYYLNLLATVSKKLSIFRHTVRETVDFYTASFNFRKRKLEIKVVRRWGSIADTYQIHYDCQIKDKETGRKVIFSDIDVSETLDKATGTLSDNLDSYFTRVEEEESDKRNKLEARRNREEERKRNEEAERFAEQD